MTHAELIRLTTLSSTAGCAAKMGPAALASVLEPLTQVFLRATNRPYLEKPVKPAELRTFVSKLVSEVH